MGSINQQNKTVVEYLADSQTGRWAAKQAGSARQSYTLHNLTMCIPMIHRFLIALK